jgi:hypothetical protein
MCVMTKVRGLAMAGAVFAVVVGFADQNVGGQGSLPPRLADYVTRHARLTAAEQALLLKGQPVAKVVESPDPSREVGVFGAVWIAAPIARYLTAVRNIEQFEKGDNFLVTKRISSPPRIEDFAQLRIPPDDLADLKSCRVGACELKVSERALAQVKKEIDWSKPTAGADVERLIRRQALEYVNGYLEGGNARLATYRDADRPTFVAQEFSSMIGRMPALTEYLPETKKYLLEFPKASLPKSESFVYWQEAKFGLKPTTRINHFTIAEHEAATVVVSKMLYASHYFWTALELRVLTPDPKRGEGFWFATVSQSRSDGLSGFVGALIRGKVQGEAREGIEAVLRTTKARMEQR